MARPKGSTNKTKTTKKTVDNKLEKENEQLKNELLEMKEMMKQLMQDKIEADKKVEDVKAEVEEEEVIDINPRDRFKIISLYHGGLNLTGRNNRPVRLEKFGQQKSVTFEDIEEILSVNHGLFKKGMFFIDSEKVIKYLALEEEYKKLIKFETLKNIFYLDEDEIENIYKNTTKDLQKTILVTFAEWINKDDEFYKNRNKIDVINRVSGQDVMKLAESLKAYES